MLCTEERQLLDEGIRRFPTFDKLYLMRGQLDERAGLLESARAAYQAGLRRCIHSVPLWKSLARMEESAGAMSRARAFLEQARMKNPGNEELWLAAVRTELRAGNAKEANTLMAKALQVRKPGVAYHNGSMSLHDREGAISAAWCSLVVLQD